MEVKIKTHLIITDIHEEYDINWCGRLLDANPLIKNGKPVFIIVGNNSRIELNTTDIKRLEEYGKKLTYPKGKEAITTDSSRIYIKEIGGNEKLACVITHRRIKTFAPMYDAVGYKD